MSLTFKVGACLRHMLEGKYGPDNFTHFLVRVSFVLLVFGLVTGLASIRSICFAFSLSLLIFCCMRMFSKNIKRRSQEERIFLRLASWIVVPLLETVEVLRARRISGLRGHISHCTICGQAMRVSNKDDWKTCRCPRCKSPHKKQSSIVQDH